eukprot:35692-Eustigmatos_ZCMA.PRE.1
MSLPRSFRYGAIPAAAPIRNYLQKVSSQSQTYTPGTSGTIQITVPACPHSYIDSQSCRLNFTVNNTTYLTSNSATSEPAVVQGSASAFINQLRVYSGASAASLIEDTQYYNHLVQYVTDISVSKNQWLGSMS